MADEGGRGRTGVLGLVVALAGAAVLGIGVLFLFAIVMPRDTPGGDVSGMQTMIVAGLVVLCFVITEVVAAAISAAALFSPRQTRASRICAALALLVGVAAFCVFVFGGPADGILRNMGS